MSFVAFPLRITDGRLDAAAERTPSVIWLLKLMASTPEGGWRGSKAFGLRGALAEMQAKADARIVAVRRANEALLDLGVDWVKVHSIETEPAKLLGATAYVFKLMYEGQGVEEMRIEI
jgi:hypothetical protein